MNAAPAFATSEGLRALLVRLDQGGPDAWRADEQASALMTYAMDKYGALARKHGQEPADAAVAAFEVLRTRAARTAQDPWAVVTRAVQLSLTYEERAAGLLCSTPRARRTSSVGLHDAERFSDRETPIYEYHPAFKVDQHWEIEAEPSTSSGAASDPETGRQSGDEEPTNAFVAVDRAVEVFVELGWPHETARTGIEYVCNRLMHAGARNTAFEYLRRDRHAQALFDLDQRCWLAMLRAVLGNQHPDRTHTSAGRGLLLLLTIGYQVDDVLAMPSITRSITRGVRAMLGGDSHV